MDFSGQAAKVRARKFSSPLTIANRQELGSSISQVEVFLSSTKIVLSIRQKPSSAPLLGGLVVIVPYLLVSFRQHISNKEDFRTRQQGRLNQGSFANLN